MFGPACMPVTVPAVCLVAPAALASGAASGTVGAVAMSGGPVGSRPAPGGGVAAPASGSRVSGSRVSLRVERELLAGSFEAVACVDEVGRGALAGPVCVAAAVVSASMSDVPDGLRDSKELSPAQRARLVPVLQRWAPYAVGFASAAEIDRWGIVTGLRLAGLRALAGLPLRPDVVLLDGNMDFLSAPRQLSLLDDQLACDGSVPDGSVSDGSVSDGSAAAALPSVVVPPVRLLVGADKSCAGVAAASVLAKEARDAVMVELDGEFPRYKWAVNKGYASRDHVAALRRDGPCVHHRRSWRLPG